MRPAIATETLSKTIISEKDRRGDANGYTMMTEREIAISCFDIH